MGLSQKMSHSTQSASLADILERVLDKGIVIAGDIKVKLVDIELLTIQIRLVICSVDKAKEIGLDWWTNNPAFGSVAAPAELNAAAPDLSVLEARLQKLEAAQAINN